MIRWREAMAAALYGDGGFFVRAGPGPAGHFRTSAHTSTRFAGALLRLVEHLDHALGCPDPFTVVDLGAGRGELLRALGAAAPTPLATRLRLVAVEVVPPADPSGDLVWATAPPASITGLLLATEWLDNVPVDVAEVDDSGQARYVLVDPASGAEALGEPVAGPDAAWLTRWWPLTVPGERAEIGRPRDLAWAGAVRTVQRGGALAVDYGHLAGRRPPIGTLTGFRDGREVLPVPDGSCDLTAHVALDAVAHAGAFALITHTHHHGEEERCVCVINAKEPGAFSVAGGGVLVRQAQALRALGVDGARPPLALAHTDPATYLRRLAAASGDAELTDPAGLGGHHWLLHPVGLTGAAPPDAAGPPAPPDAAGPPAPPGASGGSPVDVARWLT